MVKIEPPPASNAGEFAATRTDPDSPWARWAADTVASVSGKKTAVVPNSGGSPCNELFADPLGPAAIRVTHSHNACSPYAPTEHNPIAVAPAARARIARRYWAPGAGTGPSVTRPGGAPG